MIAILLLLAGETPQVVGPPPEVVVEGKKRTCQHVTAPGSRIRREKVCLTAEEAEQQSQQSREAVDAAGQFQRLRQASCPDPRFRVC